MAYPTELNIQSCKLILTCLLHLVLGRCSPLIKPSHLTSSGPLNTQKPLALLRLNILPGLRDCQNVTAPRTVNKKQEARQLSGYESMTEAHDRRRRRSFSGRQRGSGERAFAPISRTCRPPKSFSGSTSEPAALLQWLSSMLLYCYWHMP